MPVEPRICVLALPVLQAMEEFSRPTFPQRQQRLQRCLDSGIEIMRCHDSPANGREVLGIEAEHDSEVVLLCPMTAYQAILQSPRWWVRRKACRDHLEVLRGEQV